MEVRCERCSTLYDFDESRVPLEGLSVKCSSCGHVFRAYRVAQARGARDEWMVRQAGGGSVVRLDDLTTLQRWIVERRVTRDDELSRTGQSWKRLGDIGELALFFQAVDASAPTSLGVRVAPASSPPVSSPAAAFPAGYQPGYGGGPVTMAAAPFAAVPAGAQWEGAPQQLPHMPTGNWQLGNGPTDDDARAPRRGGGGKGKWLLILLVLLLAGAAAAVYVLRPDLVRRYLPARANELAVRQVASALLELQKDSSAAIGRARDLFAEAVALDAGYAPALAGLAQAELARAGHVAEEAAALETELAGAIGDARPALEARRAELRQELESRTASAFEHASAALRLEPDGVEGLRALADYYRLMKAPDRMRPVLDAARERAPRDPFVAYVLGASVAPDPELAERAIRHFDEALELAPQMNRARYELARVLLAQGNEAKARLHVETILGAVPDHERAKALLAALEPLPPAAPEPAQPAPPAPDRELTYQQLFARAERLRQNDKPEQALALFERALELQPDDPDGHTGMGWCLFDLDENDAAIASFRRALELVPRFSDAHFGLAEAYRAQGMKRDAEQHYRAYLDITPDGEDAAVAKHMLEQLRQ